VAVEAAEHRLCGDDSAGSPRLVVAIAILQTLLAVAVTASAVSAGNVFGAAIGCALLALAVAQLGTQWSMRRRLERAAEVNRALAREPRYPAGTT
jgi:hypothetical protein